MLDYLHNIIIGGWQLSAGHSQEADREGLRVIERYYQAGFRTFDCADIYTGVEALLGSFIKTHGLSSKDIHIHTKYVPDMASLASLDFEQTEAVIDRSRKRLGLERLDLVQFHWWHYPTGNYLAALESLLQLRQAGKVKEIGLTNFDAHHLQEVLDHGIPIASIQSQFSLIDQRVKTTMVALLEQHDISLLCYGSVAGGLLSDTWLGQAEPQEPLENRSLVKYLLMVEEMGGWEALQSLLKTLREVADQHDSDIASIASSYCLAQTDNIACIIGARSSRHLAQHLRLRDQLRLSVEQRAVIEASRAQFKAIPGAVYALERDMHGKHGRIMKYNLNSI